MSALLFLPAYVLIDGQINQQNQSADKAAQSVKEFAEASRSIAEANKQARLADEAGKAIRISALITQIESLQGDRVDINSLSFSRQQEDGSLDKIMVAGVADDRRSLASFRDRLLAKDWIISADLPISNLAQSSDIPFSIPVQVKIDNKDSL